MTTISKFEEFFDCHFARTATAFYINLNLCVFSYIVGSVFGNFLCAGGDDAIGYQFYPAVVIEVKFVFYSIYCVFIDVFGWQFINIYNATAANTLLGQLIKKSIDTALRCGETFHAGIVYTIFKILLHPRLRREVYGFAIYHGI